jgi:hypothetical protein
MGHSKGPVTSRYIHTIDTAFDRRNAADYADASNRHCEGNAVPTANCVMLLGMIAYRYSDRVKGPRTFCYVFGFRPATAS